MGKKEISEEIEALQEIDKSMTLVMSIIKKMTEATKFIRELKSIHREESPQ